MRGIGRSVKGYSAPPDLAEIGGDHVTEGAAAAVQPRQANSWHLCSPRRTRRLLGAAAKLLSKQINEV